LQKFLNALESLKIFSNSQSIKIKDSEKKCKSIVLKKESIRGAQSPHEKLGSPRNRGQIFEKMPSLYYFFDFGLKLDR